MASRINADSSNGLQLVSDSSGEIQFQSSGITKATVNSSGLSSPGHVLQVVQGLTSTQVSTSSSTYVDTGLTATITPSSLSSKILVIVSHPSCAKSSAFAANNMGLKLYRDATQIGAAGAGLGYTNSAIELIFSTNIVVLDSPSTTSATTYKTQFHNANNTAAVLVQVSSIASTITLLEIAG